MKPISESTLQARCLRYLRESHPNIYYEKIINGNRAGLPDLRLCIKGKFVAVELKSLKGKVSELQAHNLHKITKAGGIALISNDLVQFKQLICEIANSLP